MLSTVNSSSAIIPSARHPRSTSAALFAAVLVAIAARVAWRLYRGEPDFWASGSPVFYDLAKNLVAGRGLGLEAADRAWCVPGYPLFLALAILTGKSYLAIVVLEALAGAGTVLCAYLIGKELFSGSIGLVAAFVTAIYPFYVFYDTSLQESSLLTFLTAFSVFLLLRSRRISTVVGWTVTGLALGAVVLTNQTLAPFAAGALVWIFLFGEGTLHRKFDRLIAVAAPLCLVIGLWVARNYMTVGAPVLTSSFGRQLWNANNPNTFSHFPNASLDRSSEDALAPLSREDQQDLDGISDEILKSDWFRDKAFDYMAEHPGETAWNAARKVLSAF